jgi:hypothetical protein
MKCKLCDGSGEAYYEKPVVDYQNGGFLDTVLMECDDCGGSGEVEDEDEDDYGDWLYERWKDKKHEDDG